MTISTKTLQELLPRSLLSSPSVSVEYDNKIWMASVLLIHYLESFTDSLVVTKNTLPIGVLGGKDIIENLIKNPTSEFFDAKIVQELMHKEIHIVTKNTTLYDLLNSWKNSRRAFSIIKNSIGGYSSISARTILEIGIRCKTSMKLSDLPQKTPITFNENDSIGDIMQLMLKHGTRKLLLENTNYFISDRIIIEKISRDLDYLREKDDFLSTPAKLFNLSQAKIISNDLSLPKVYDIMFGLLHPHMIHNGQVLSPWDLCIALLSDEFTI